MATERGILLHRFTDSRGNKMNIAVVFAGGVGQRMQNGGLPKQFMEIHDKPIIIHTIEHFEKHAEIDAIVIACVADWIDYMQELADKYKITKVKRIVPGGETGQLSIYNGLVAAEEYANEAGESEKNVVLIHDGVRPLINAKLITDCIASVKKYGSAITSVVVKETVLMVHDSETNEIEHIPNRANTRLARAPQCFFLEDILGAERKAVEAGEINFIDSCSLMQSAGMKLHLVDGPMENIKVTTPDDYYSVKALLDARKELPQNN